MTVKDHITDFVTHISAAQHELSQLDSKEMDALLKRWYDYRQTWVSPYEGEGHMKRPSFCPQWYQLTVDIDANAEDFQFNGWVCGETEITYVPVAFFVDPDAWEEEDKKQRVTAEEWAIQRYQHMSQRADQLKQAELAKAAALLRSAGWEVNGQ